MTKSEFLEKLRAALGNDLSGAIIQENVNYYSSYISEETGKGRSEAEVIAELGDPWALARTVIDAAEGRDTADSSCGGAYEYEPEQSYDGQYRKTRLAYSFGFHSWWKKLLLILVIVGVIMIVVSIISGLVSLLAPVLIPLIIVMIIVRAIGRRR